MSMRSFNRPHRLTAAVLAVAALGLGLLVSPPAFAAAPPVPGGLSVSQPNTSTPILAWTLRPRGATKYEVQVDNDAPASTSPELKASTTTNFRAIVPTTALSAGPGPLARARRSTAPNETSDWVRRAQFTVAPVGVPEPVSPSRRPPEAFCSSNRRARRCSSGGSSSQGATSPTRCSSTRTRT